MATKRAYVKTGEDDRYMFSFPIEDRKYSVGEIIVDADNIVHEVIFDDAVATRVKAKEIKVSVNQSLFEKPIELMRYVKKDGNHDEYVEINDERYYLKDMMSAGRRGYFINKW